MPNFVALSVYRTTQSSATTSVAFPFFGNGGIVVETQPSFVIAGVTILSAIIVPSTGLNQKQRIYYSALSVSAVLTALGAGFISTNTWNSTNAVGVATATLFPADGASGIVIEAASGITINGTAVLSQIIVPANGLNQKARIYYSASTVAALVTLFG